MNNRSNYSKVAQGLRGFSGEASIKTIATPEWKGLNACKLLVAIFSAAICLGPFEANAQDEAGDRVYELEAYSVDGYRSAMAAAIEAKRTSDQVTDSITAEEIGQFPDLNLAEAIQRITGVAMTRNNGEGEKVAVRGLAPNFTRVEIDGRASMVTVDDSAPERDAQLSVFNSDLYSKIEVIKSPSARDVEGGIGGSVKLSTHDPLDVGGKSWGTDVSYSHSATKDAGEPGFSGYYSNIFADGKLGFLIHGTYEDRDRRIDKVQNNQNYRIVGTGNLVDDMDPAALALVGSAFPNRVRYEYRAGDNPRVNLNAKLQFRPTEDLEFYLNSLYTIETRFEDRSRMQFTLGGNNGGDIISGVVDPVTNTLTQASFEGIRSEYQSFIRDAEVDSVGVTGGVKWANSGPWSGAFEVSTSFGEEDFHEARFQNRVNNDEATYNMSPNYKLPEFSSPTLTSDPNDLGLRELSQQRRIIAWAEDVAKLDFKYELEDGFFSSLETGVRLSQSEFDRKQVRVLADHSGLSIGDGMSPYGPDGTFFDGAGSAGFPMDIPDANPLELLEIRPLSGPIVFPEVSGGDVYVVTEDVSAAYLQGNFQGRMNEVRTQGNIGVRVVKTETNGVGGLTINDTPDEEEIIVSNFSGLNQSYTEALPSFNITFAPDNPNAGHLFRAAVSKVLTSPTVGEMNPNWEVDYAGAEISRGNPTLDPFMAWQFDLGFEYYFGKNNEGLFSIAGVKKDVESFISPVTISGETRDFGIAGLDSQEYLVDTYRNIGDAKIDGVEISWQSPFTFLPGIWSDFGAMVNYTFIDSNFIDEFGNSNPFPGTSENTYNIVAFYEKEGFSTRVAYNFRDDYLIVPSGASDGTNNEFVEGSGRVDIGVRYRWENGFKIALDLINVTEEQRYIYYDVIDRLEDLTNEGMTTNLSIGYKF